MRIAGVVLAAGAGRRMGGPKALLRRADGTTWAEHAVGLLAEAGCDPVLVTVSGFTVNGETIEVPDRDRGPGAGIARVLAHPAITDVDAVAVTLVDLPLLTVDGIRDVLAHAARDVLVRAVEHGRPGHPVLLGRDHVHEALAIAATGSGLAELFRGATLVEVPGSSTDADTPADIPTDIPPT